mmetsp:Transcript_50021/g.140217  ORF Transcript_50021/g.140217 Transcript_50021/m.140217 type:complete len:345 (-) Transcript_50021:1218-2252(-)
MVGVPAGLETHRAPRVVLPHAVHRAVDAEDHRAVCHSTSAHNALHGNRIVQLVEIMHFFTGLEVVPSPEIPIAQLVIAIVAAAHELALLRHDERVRSAQGHLADAVPHQLERRLALPPASRDAVASAVERAIGEQDCRADSGHDGLHLHVGPEKARLPAAVHPSGVQVVGDLAYGQRPEAGEAGSPNGVIVQHHEGVELAGREQAHVARDEQHGRVLVIHVPEAKLSVLLLPASEEATIRHEEERGVPSRRHLDYALIEDLCGLIPVSGVAEPQLAMLIEPEGIRAAILEQDQRMVQPCGDRYSAAHDLIRADAETGFPLDAGAAQLAIGIRAPGVHGPALSEV